jgi:hypothetical protein
LIAAAYASIRVSMILGRFLEAREAGGDGSFLSGLPGLGKKQHAIDRRMAERRARVEAAQKRDNEMTEPKEDARDE